MCCACRAAGPRRSFDPRHARRLEPAASGGNPRCPRAHDHRHGRHDPPGASALRYQPTPQSKTPATLDPSIQLERVLMVKNPDEPSRAPDAKPRACTGRRSQNRVRIPDLTPHANKSLACQEKPLFPYRQFDELQASWRPPD